MRQNNRAKIEGYSLIMIENSKIKQHFAFRISHWIKIQAKAGSIRQKIVSYSKIISISNKS